MNIIIYVQLKLEEFWKYKYFIALGYNIVIFGVAVPPKAVWSAICHIIHFK